MTEIAISARGVGKRYKLYNGAFDRLADLALPFGRPRARDFWALRGLDLEVPRGATWGIIGRNGSGKSTALKMLAGRLRPTEGTVEAKGRICPILELGTGMNPRLTGRQNARDNGLFMGLDPWQVEERLDEVMEFAEIGAFADQPLETYSSGMKGRLAFSVLTALEPEIMILDEALATGDAGFAHKCTRFIRSLCRSGCTTLVVSHDMAFVTDTCEHLVWLEDGKVKARGRPDELAREYLASLGEDGADFQVRPRNALFRLAPLAPGETPKVGLHCLEWRDRAGAVIGQLHPWRPKDFVRIVESASELGFLPGAALAGWGEPAQMASSPPEWWARPVEPHRGPGGAAFLAAPLPTAPRPLPASVRLLLWAEAEQRLALSALVDGHFQPLGTIVVPGGGQHWTDDLPLGRAVAASAAAPAAAGAPA